MVCATLICAPVNWQQSWRLTDVSPVMCATAARPASVNVVQPWRLRAAMPASGTSATRPSSRNGTSRHPSRLSALKDASLGEAQCHLPVSAADLPRQSPYMSVNWAANHCPLPGRYAATFKDSAKRITSNNRSTGTAGLLVPGLDGAPGTMM